jgi:predicted AAA+ superfamily ATPase
MTGIIRDFESTLSQRLAQNLPFIQVLVGPRQVGKTTAVRRIVERWNGPKVFVSADDPTPKSAAWLSKQWKLAQQKGPGTLFVVDEIQKVDSWSEAIKELYDPIREKRELSVVLLGSASLSIQSGLSAALTGRFELNRATHWSYAESAREFGWDLQQYLLYGGYPAASLLIDSDQRWRSFILDSIIEPVLGRDIGGIVPILKPALFRQTFELAMQHPCRIISYNKLLGQLQDRGNTTTIRHYLELIEGAFLLKLLPRFSGNQIRAKSSSPKLLPLAPALSQAYRPESLSPDDATWQGFVFEAAVGAELAKLPGKLSYWSDGNFEVDFIREVNGRTIAYEVKSKRTKNPRSLERFMQQYSGAEIQIVTPDIFCELAAKSDALLSGL